MTMHRRPAPGWLVSLSVISASTIPLIACGSVDGGDPGAGVRDSAGVRIVDNGLLGPDTCAVSPTPSLDLGVVEGEKEYQLYRVFDAATLSDGRIAVVNQGSGQIRLYSAEGVFDRAFGAEGDGPGEFRRVFQISVTEGDTLLVGDYRPYRYSIFTADGEFVRAVVPEPPYINNPEFIAPMSDGTFLAAAEDHVMPERQGEWPAITQSVILHGPDGAVIDTLATLPYGHTGWLDQDIGFMGRPLFEPISVVVAAGGRIVIGPGDVREFSLFEIRPATAESASVTEGVPSTSSIGLGRPSAIVRWSGDDLAVTDAAIDDYRRRVLDNADANATPMSRRFLEASISADRPVSERFPAYGALAIGLEGDIWVEESARGEEPADREWLVFEADGRFRCHARLPFRYSWDLYEIAPDYVLGKVEDELGVEHVRRYALERP